VGTVRCPDCGRDLVVPAGAHSGDLLDCPDCAGLSVRLREDDGGWSATLAYRVSCPDCDDVMTLPEDARPSDTVSCCGRIYRLTFEYGAFAAEKM
jgi:hypothetical protein